MSGGFNYLLRGGGAANSDLELILRSLANARGSAVISEEGTIAWVEDVALARALLSASETIRRFQLQFNPLSMTSFLQRWEQILKIYPNATATMNERRRTVDAKFKLIGVGPFVQNVQDFLNNILGTMFVETIRTPAGSAYTTYPGGVTIPGGLTIPAGDWYSTISNMLIRVSQPLNMSDSEFYDTVSNFKPFLYDFLPAYTTFNWGRFGLQDGTVSCTDLSATLTGSGTLFLTGIAGAVAPGETLEIYDDAAVLHSCIVASVESDTSLTLQSPLNGTTITSKEWRRFGFYLDVVNLDNAFLQ